LDKGGEKLLWQKTKRKKKREFHRGYSEKNVSQKRVSLQQGG